VGIVQDLTEQKQAQQAFEREKAKRVEQLEREISSLTKLSSSPTTSVTAAMYGVKSLRAVSHEKKKACTGEGWLMAIKLMGELTSFYRNRADSTNILASSKTKKRESKHS